MEYHYDKESICFHHGQARFTITPFQGGIFRITVEKSHALPPSFAIDTLPPLAQAELIRSATEIQIHAEGYQFTIKDQHRVGDRNALSFSFFKDALCYAEGSLFRNTDNGFRWKSLLRPEDCVYGLGEKTGVLDKRHFTWTMWNTDEPHQAPHADPLYQSIPWAIMWNGTRCMGILFDTVAHTCFDIGDTHRDELAVEGEDDVMDCYFIPGAEPKEVLAKYTKLTGCMQLPPLWSLGFQQSRYSYYPDFRILQLSEEFRRRGIPCDVIYLDIHYMEDYKVFTWDKSRFPDPKQLMALLKKKGFRTVIIVDPGVKIAEDYAPYQEGLAAGMFCMDEKGTVYEGEVWPGPAVYPDFTKASVRQWWANWHRSSLGIGVSGIWNDMNEPSNFSNSIDCEKAGRTVPNHIIMDHDGHPKAFSSYHNAYAIEMNRATHTAFADIVPNLRPFVLTRAGSPGIQKYAAVWTGDNSSWWEHFATSLPMLMNLGLSGVAFVGCDAGGFQGNASPELYARWIAAASFTPFFRAHSMIGSKDHEPWSFGEEVEAIAKKYISLRYELLPYFYTLFEGASRSGEPIVQALVYRYPFDKNTWNLHDQFLIGDFMVAPILSPGIAHRAVYLPEGTWYNYWTGEVYEGGRSILAEAPLDTLPVYVQGGSFLSYEALRQHTNEPRKGNLTVRVYPRADGRAEGSLYDDEGEGFSYRDGDFCRVHFSLRDRRLVVKKEGKRALSWDSLIFVLGDRKRELDSTLKDTQEVPFV